MVRLGLCVVRARCRQFLSALLGPLVLAAAAQSATPPTPPAGLSMDQAVRKVEEQYHARVVKAETVQSEGHPVYLLRLLNESGKVWTVRVDPASGAVQ